MEKGRVYLFLDEVQRIGGWEKYIRSIYDEFKGKIEIFVSGSNASLLSRDYGNLLTGRHITTTLLPLSFKEFLGFKKQKTSRPLTEKDRATTKKLLEEYLEYGGFPEVVLTENKEQMLSQLFSDILTRDITARTVRKENILEEFAYYLAGNITTPLSFNRMAKYFNARGIKVSVQTLENYFWLIKNSFLFFDSLAFSHKIRDQLKNPKKIYCVDNGIANVIGFKSSGNYGRIYENTVFLKLKKDSADNPLARIYYWKSQQKEEVDFVVKEGENVRHLVQVCYDLENPETKKRELKALLKASKELKCKNLLIITKDCEAEEKTNGRTIRYTPLWKWLLDQ
jgi:predicted AAA+ superfamily ATPase